MIQEVNIHKTIFNWMQEQDGRSISNLSRLSGISRSTISNILLERHAPRIQTVIKILSSMVSEEKANNFVINKCMFNNMTQKI